MAVEEILQDLLSESFENGNTTAAMAKHSSSEIEPFASRPEALIVALERECKLVYNGRGEGIHFVGLLLAIFAAELVSGYWASNRVRVRVGSDHERKRLVSCLYSEKEVAFVLAHPTKMHERLNEKVREVWQGEFPKILSGGKNENDDPYMVSAAVRFPEDGCSEAKEPSLPFFSCPRKYSNFSEPHNGDPSYLNERFEESYVLSPIAMALKTHSIRDALKGILTAFPPRDTIVNETTPESEYAIMIHQFSRGYGRNLTWIDDPNLQRNAKLELDTFESLASSKVIGSFGSLIQPTILFQHDNILGIYSPLSKEFSILSKCADFFEAGVEYSAYDLVSPVTAEPNHTVTTPPSTKMDDVQPTQLNNFINLPSNVALFPFSNKLSQVPQTPNRGLDSPSFFSPSFADHLNPSTTTAVHDPRIRTVSFPLQLNSPTRSQSYPSTPSPVRSGALSSSYSSMSRSQTSALAAHRSSDSPPPNITPVSCQELEKLIADGLDILLIDIRAFAAYAKSRLTDAINVCIPTVLLKRSSLSMSDISGTIVSKGDRGRFSAWKEADGIVLYDADSLRVKDSHPLATLAGKFKEAGFEGTTYGLIGGFAGLVETPSLIDDTPLANKVISSPTSPRFFTSTVNTSRPAPLDAATRLALECKESPLFARSSTAQVPGAPAFFSNIRQNMDLHGGVGPVIPITAPKIPPKIKIQLPRWLASVAYSTEGPQLLAQRWEEIELAEKTRLESVLTGDGMQGKFSISSAMERGEKNRYPNIWPYEWNRVKIPQAGSGYDYFNGNFLVPKYGIGRRYLATQAPIPSTFEDFWKVVWGDGIQVLVCLTAEEEGGQIKCHPYWNQGTWGPMHVTPMHQTKVPLAGDQFVTIRTLMVENREEPFASIREVVQLHYEGWPDFGTPAQPASIISVVKLLNQVISQRQQGKDSPIIVHCSAGCGRTGTFVIVDSLLNYFEREGNFGDEKDVIQESVLALREQRMSLVQTLRQYVLCYESVLHEVVDLISKQ